MNLATEHQTQEVSLPSSWCGQVNNDGELFLPFPYLPAHRFASSMAQTLLL
jgi:hypothetical protein